MRILRALVAAPVTCITLKVILEIRWPDDCWSKNELGRTVNLINKSVLRLCTNRLDIDARR